MVIAPSLTAVIPTLDEARRIGALVGALREECDQVVVSDGGSRDGTASIARQAGARVLIGPAGRGGQLRRGLLAATGEVLWLLHADVIIQPGTGGAIRLAAMQAPWGCCPVRITSPDRRLKLTAAWMNQRARKSGSATGDMGCWFRREFLDQIGGVPDLPAFEDLVLSDRARKETLPRLVPAWLEVSDRRWQQEGVNRTILRMWGLRALYRAGLSPELLARAYRSNPR